MQSDPYPTMETPDSFTGISRSPAGDISPRQLSLFPVDHRQLDLFQKPAPDERSEVQPIEHRSPGPIECYQIPGRIVWNDWENFLNSTK